MSGLRLHPVPNAALEADIATIAQKGAGKTYANRGLVERILDQRRRVVVLDPLNSWWGLKARANGKPGYAVAVVGGPNADIPLDPEKGEQLGDFIAGGDLSVVIDVSDLRRGEMIRFATAFLQALYRTNRDPLWLVLEEADVFAPQQPMGDATRLLHEVDQIARRGRARGFRLWTITQRPAKLHKDVLTQTSTLIMLRIRSPQDRAAAEAWINGNAESAKAREIVSTLASLPVGEGWVWSPDNDLLERVRFPPIKTLDTSATPEAGAARPAAGKLAVADLASLRAAIVAPSAPDAGSTDHVSADIERARQAGYLQGYEIGAKKAHAEGVAHGLRHASADLTHLAEKLRVEAESILREAGIKPASADATPLASSEKKPAQPASPARQLEQARADGSVSGPQAKVLRSLLWWQAVGIEAPTRTQVAIVAGWSPKSSNIRDRSGELASAGLVDRPGPGALSLTTKGREVARSIGSDASMPTNRVDAVRAILTAPQAKLFDALLQRTAGAPRDELATACGWSVDSSNIRDRAGELVRLELLNRPQPGWLKLESWVTA